MVDENDDHHQEQKQQHHDDDNNINNKERNLLSETLNQCQFPIGNFGGLQYWNTTSTHLFRTAFVLGGPGAGKGTQSTLMAKHYPCVHLSVGQLLRDEVEKKDPRSSYGQIIAQCLVDGTIVPVEISLGLLHQEMTRQVQDENVSDVDASTIFLVDGFPRNDDNLMGWCRTMCGGHRQENVAALWNVFVYECPLEVLEQRILERGQKGSGRTDDNLISLQKRFCTFQEETLPIVRELRAISNRQVHPQEREQQSLSSPAPVSSFPRWCVHDVRGDEPLEMVWEKTQHLLNQLILHDVLSCNDALIKSIERKDAQTYQSLVDPSWLIKHQDSQKSQKDEEEFLDPFAVMKQHEDCSFGDDLDDERVLIVGHKIHIENASYEVLGGKQVAIQYVRTIGGSEDDNNHDNDDGDTHHKNKKKKLIEKRIWTHQGTKGWRNVHYTRTPLRFE